MLVVSIVTSSYIQADAFAGIILAGVIVSAAVLATLAYANALGWRTENPADAPAFGNALYDSFDEVHKQVMVAVGVGVLAGGQISKISSEFAAFLHAKSLEFFNSTTNNFEIVKPLKVFSAWGAYDYFLGSSSVVYAFIDGSFHSYAVPLAYQGNIRFKMLANLQGRSYVDFYTDGGIFEIVLNHYVSTVQVSINNDAAALAAISGTVLPLDTTLDTRRSAVPPLPMELPAVAADGTTSIPYDVPIVDTLPTDVVDSIPADVPISITDALTVPATVVPDATTGNVDLDMVKLPLTLKDKFPFCIPFDFMKGIGLLRGNPVAPVFDFPFVIQSLGIHEHFLIDLSIFDTLASVLRWFLSLLFTIMLIVATRRFIL
ncbi:MAG: hypothetical protein JJE17_12145 [Peptostreptococcaceae bacterium]|nr:hypothetical protein [Peptostreptococcaceae bacterium]